MPPMARFSGNIEYVAVGKKTEVPLLIASLQAMKHIIEEHTTPNIQLNISLNLSQIPLENSHVRYGSLGVVIRDP